VGPWSLVSYSPSDLWKLPGKIRLQELVSSNSENISCVSLWNTKTAENMELALWHFVNRLVPENT
jgi:hypothetical protein